MDPIQDNLDIEIVRSLKSAIYHKDITSSTKVKYSP